MTIVQNTASPADVLGHYLVASGVARWPDTAGPATLWSLHVGTMPDEGTNALAVYDTAGVLQRRIMRTGQKREKFGVQLRIRSTDYLVGFNKGRALANILDAIYRAPVAMSEDLVVLLHNASRTSTVVPLGREIGKQRYLFTLNALLRMHEQ